MHSGVAGCGHDAMPSGTEGSTSRDGRNIRGPYAPNPPEFHESEPGVTDWQQPREPSPHRLEPAEGTLHRLLGADFKMLKTKRKSAGLAGLKKKVQFL
jgi:hypothetical protein